MYKGKNILLQFKVKVSPSVQTKKRVNLEMWVWERSRVMTWLDFLNFYFFLTFPLNEENFHFTPSLRNDCIKHIIFSSFIFSRMPNREKRCVNKYIVIIFLFDTYEKQFAFLSPYIIMYLMPRWLQCRAKNEWKWMKERRKSSERRYLIIHFYMLH